MKRGSVYWINLEPANAPELGKVRPGIVVSNTEHNIRLPSLLVVPLSSQAPEIWPLRLAVSIPGLKNSFAIIPGLRQISKTRLHDLVSYVPEAFLRELDKALAAYLSD